MIDGNVGWVLSFRVMNFLLDLLDVDNLIAYCTVYSDSVLPTIITNNEHITRNHPAAVYFVNRKYQIDFQ